MVFSGTLVGTGQATAAVTSTGTATQIGRISGMLNRVEDLTTPLLRQINSFARWFTLFIFLGAALLFALAVTVRGFRSEEHTSELQSLMRTSYAGFCYKKK